MAHCDTLKLGGQLLSNLISPLDRLGPAQFFSEDILSDIIHWWGLLAK